MIFVFGDLFTDFSLKNQIHMEESKEKSDA